MDAVARFRMDDTGLPISTSRVRMVPRIGARIVEDIDWPLEHNVRARQHGFDPPARQILRVRAVDGVSRLADSQFVSNFVFQAVSPTLEARATRQVRALPAQRYLRRR
jgi:hypothetical protein